MINLLRYFRNCTTHRYLISLHKKGGWYNENTSEFKAIDGVMYEPPWNPLRVEVPWISVPEITHLKDGNNTQNESLRFYEHPLVLFVISICSFVVLQRQKLLNIENDELFDNIRRSLMVILVHSLAATL